VIYGQVLRMRIRMGLHLSKELKRSCGRYIGAEVDGGVG
ncbi:hypothetical protein Tco_1566933, partial [Tanacetum coccineum]